MTHYEKKKFRHLKRCVAAYDQHMQAHPDSVYMTNGLLIERGKLWVEVQVALRDLDPNPDTPPV